MRGAQSISTRRAYGVQRVCRVWHCARSSVYARRQALSSAPGRRRGPIGAAPDDVLVGHIRRVLRLALLEFKRTYNEQWMLEKYDYRSPARVRRDLGGLDAAA